MVREDGVVVFYYARYADDMVFGLPRGDKSTRVTQGLKKVLARVLRELLQGFTSTEISRKQPGRLQIIGLPLSLKSEGQLHVGIPSKRWEKRMTLVRIENRRRREREHARIYSMGWLQANPTAEVESIIFRFFQHLIRNRAQKFLEEKGMPTTNA
ncbi:hypothetical protein VPH35_022289 [Triticum aestivum]